MDYYEAQFRSDLRRYCAERNDAALLHMHPPDSYEAPYHRQVRLGSAGWEPQRRDDFYFCLYFTVLTDMALHAHFPAQHRVFDRLAQYPKLFGMGIRSRCLPRAALFYVRFDRARAPEARRLWDDYCAYFVQNWQSSLPGICGVDGVDFLRSLLADPDLEGRGGSIEPQYESNDGDCRNPGEYLESLLLEHIRHEVARLQGQEVR